MTWYKDFYVGEGIAGKDDKKRHRKAEKIKWKILHNAGQFDIYVIALGSHPDNLLDIIPAWELRQKYYPKSDMVVVGVDKGYDNVIDLVGKIVMDIYRKTGDFKIKDYFLENSKENLKSEPPWESCY